MCPVSLSVYRTTTSLEEFSYKKKPATGLFVAAEGEEVSPVLPVPSWFVLFPEEFAGVPKGNNSSEGITSGTLMEKFSCRL